MRGNVPWFSSFFVAEYAQICGATVVETSSRKIKAWGNVEKIAHLERRMSTPKRRRRGSILSNGPKRSLSGRVGSSDKGRRNGAVPESRRSRHTTSGASTIGCPSIFSGTQRFFFNFLLECDSSSLDAHLACRACNQLTCVGCFGVFNFKPYFFEFIVMCYHHDLCILLLSTSRDT